MVHLRYWCIIDPFWCKLSLTDVSIKIYLEYAGLFSQMYLCIITFECIWLCSADKILLHVNMTYSWLTYNSCYNFIVENYLRDPITVPVVHSLSREKDQITLKSKKKFYKKPIQVFMISDLPFMLEPFCFYLYLERWCKPFHQEKTPYESDDG